MSSVSIAINAGALSPIGEPFAMFPPKDDLWAWAHVHIDRNIVGEGDDPISSDEPDFINKFKDKYIIYILLYIK